MKCWRVKMLFGVAVFGVAGTSASSQAPNAILQFSNAELLAAQRRALLQVAPEPRVDRTGQTRVTVCVSVNRGGQEFAADSATLAMLDIPGRVAVIPRDCPRTYVMAMYSTDRAPPGYIDPYYMSVARVAALDTSTLVVTVDVTQDIHAKSYRCSVSRDAAAWRATCELFRTTVGQ